MEEVNGSVAQKENEEILQPKKKKKAGLKDIIVVADIDPVTGSNEEQSLLGNEE